MSKYPLIGLLFLTSSLFSIPPQFKEALQSPNPLALELLLKELSPEEREALLPELRKKIVEIKQQREQNLTLLKPSWDSAKFFGGLALAGVAGSMATRRFNHSQSYTTSGLLGTLGLYYAYRGTQYHYQKKYINAARDIEAFLHGTKLKPKELNEHWYQELGSPGVGLITSTTGIALEALKGNRLATAGLLATAGTLAIEQGLQVWQSLPTIPEDVRDLSNPALKEQLIAAIEASDVGRTHALLNVLGKPIYPDYENGLLNREFLNLLTDKAAQVAEQRKEQLLLPRTIKDSIKMAGGTTFALLGLCAKEFLDNAYAKKAGIIASCLGIYQGYHGLRRSSQRDLYQQAQLIKDLIDLKKN